MIQQKKCPFCGKSTHDSYGGFANCPTIIKKKAVYALQKKITATNFFGESPAPFVGRFNYPNIDVGLLSPPEEHDNVWKFDAPRYWAENCLKIPEIVNYRAGLVNSTFRSNVNSPRIKDKILDIAQQSGIASRPIELEVELIKRPVFNINFNSITPPTGPNIGLKQAKITSNPKIDTKVDKVVDDSDLRAAEGLTYLYSSGFDENFLSRMLSVGTMGVKTQRKLVPTRWSITAVDDTLGKELIEEIKDYSQTGNIAYYGGHLGNYFLIMLFDDVWSYELFEMVSAQSGEDISYTTDFELVSGRKEYAFETSGGYYAARLGILEHLKSIRRQSGVLALRFITKDYDTPLGVWVVREAVRKTLASKPIEFGSKELMLKFALMLAQKKHSINIAKVQKKSILLNNIKNQRKLTDYVYS